MTESFRRPAGGSAGRGASIPAVGFLGYGLDRPLSGIGRYTVELATALAQHRGEVDLTLIKPFAEPAPGLEHQFPATRVWGRLLPAFMTLGPPQIAAVARRHGFDVVHDPFGVSPFLAPRRLAPFGRIVTIHDAIPFTHPETHARLTNLLFTRYIPRTLRFVDAVVTVSEASKHDLVRHFKIHPDRVQVIPNGVSALFQPADVTTVRAVNSRYGLPERYILTVGALQARKNLETLFESYRELRQRGIEHRLVIVGSEAWKTAGAFRRLRALGLESKVTFTGYVPDDDLPALYSGADLFAFPSVAEGFGLPPLEAMACGTPVVASNASSLPEVVGDAGLMVPPYDLRELTAALYRVLTNRATAADLRRRGLERARDFTWERSASAHIALYRAIAELYSRAPGTQP